ncbi:hypothetical protein DICPUDRAFT_152967 [Dictyostelium purpureum]|uniref:tRNA-binding domain-containing protein n=1 Tax=Dictyostelium purpureum TaxID=5786 RepID=F0ZMQ6_DICPU|nr:uncharacterized protein DICPUDRAFT_152967 [Dictyostelium purpureum]EGC34787.1 hypothetical protein DICPUDRAFT_152967 [Dictyostelium purpureum]|eukprot:XP_003288702.1 hypothetical protein DICPUDRAFT_152967 [Dictyostelium purpureum]
MELPTTPEEIDIEDFFKVDLRVAKVIDAQHVEKANKLLKLTLDLGLKKVKPQPQVEQKSPEENINTTTTTEELKPTVESQVTESPVQPERDIRTVFSGIKAYYSPEQLIGKNVIYCANLKKRTMKFGVSEGMVLCASDEEGKKVLYTTTDDGSEPGMRVF